MAYHYNLLNELYYGVCADIAKREHREQPSEFDQLMTVINVVEVYKHELNQQTDLEDRVIGLTELAFWQKEKQLELHSAGVIQ